MKNYFAIVSDEKHSMSRINFAGAEVARLNPHDCAVFQLLEA